MATQKPPTIETPKAEAKTIKEDAGAPDAGVKSEGAAIPFDQLPIRPKTGGEKGMNYKDMIRILFVGSSGLKYDLDVSQETFDKLAVADAKTQQGKNKLDAASRTGRDSQAIDVNLILLEESIKTVNREQQKMLSQQKAGFQTEFADLKAKSKELSTESKTHSQQFQKLVTENRETISEFITTKPKGSYTPEDAARLLSKINNNVKQFTDSVDKFADAQQKNQSSLRALNLETGNAIPAGYRAIAEASGRFRKTAPTAGTPSQTTATTQTTPTTPRTKGG